MKWYMNGIAGRNPMLCNVEGEGEGNQSGSGSGDQPSIDDLVKRLEAVEGMKEKAVGESKSEREKRKALEAKLAELQAAEEARKEAEAKKRGEFEKLASEKDAKAKELQSKLDNTLKANAMKDGLASIDLLPSTRAFVEAKFAGSVTIEGETALIDGKSPAEFFKAWSETDEAKPFIKNGSSGGGAGGGSGNGGGKHKKPSEMTATEEAAYLNAAKAQGLEAYRKAQQELGYA